MITPLCHRGIRSKNGAQFLRAPQATAKRSNSALPWSNHEAAKLLMHMHRIALQETITNSGSANGIVRVSSDVPEEGKNKRDEIRSFSPIPLPTPPSLHAKTSIALKPTRRSRIISVCSMDDMTDSPSQGSASSSAVVCVTPTTADRAITFIAPKPLESSSLPMMDESPSTVRQNHIMALHTKNPVPYTPQDSKKLVGNKLPPGIETKNILRKKFSWKSFPELEAYLVQHRDQYLDFSNSLNYTKAQKLYNNHLTQGLLDLAAQEGYIFEGFSFPAIRDRIRCFYKSYVQATKKKKRTAFRSRSRV